MSEEVKETKDTANDVSKKKSFSLKKVIIGTVVGVAAVAAGIAAIVLVKKNGATTEVPSITE